MSLICLASAHGSPGVTTTALALAGVWPEGRQYLLVEADPFGGVIAARFSLQDTPGLASLAAAARNGLDAAIVDQHTQQLPGGVPVLIGPPTAEHAHAVLRDMAPLLAEWCARTSDVDLIVDCGRLSPGSPVLDLMPEAESVLVVSRPVVDQLRLAGHRAKSLDARGVAASLLLVGDQPYGPDEAAAALQLGVSGVMAWDPEAAAMLSGGGGNQDLRLSLLVRSAATLASELTGADIEPASRPPVVESQLSTQPATAGGEVTT